jgi:hypothetical protein
MLTGSAIAYQLMKSKMWMNKEREIEITQDTEKRR